MLCVCCMCYIHAYVYIYIYIYMLSYVILRMLNVNRLWYVMFAFNCDRWRNGSLFSSARPQPGRRRAIHGTPVESGAEILTRYRMLYYVTLLQYYTILYHTTLYYTILYYTTLY